MNPHKWDSLLQMSALFYPSSSVAAVAQLSAEQLPRHRVIWANIPRLQLQHPKERSATTWVTF